MEKKKVGILTYHRADNYGAVLQCYALQEAIETLGHNVEIINYRQPYIENIYKPIQKKELQNTLRRPRWYFSYFFKLLPQKIYKHIKYRLFRKRHLKTSKVFDSHKNFPCKYDTIIVGSDQVWGIHCTNGIDEIFFGEFPKKGCKILGYGISGNVNSLKKVGVKKLTKYCNNFDQLSFREESFQAYIKEHIGIIGELVLDPTLLLDKKIWVLLASDTKEKNDYVLIYLLQQVKDISGLNKDLTTFAKTKNCKLINIFDVAHSPTEFLGWIRNAKYIFTTSFHATVFSIIFEKDIYTLKTHNGHDVRYIDLLSKLNIGNRAIEANDILSINEEAINYTVVKNKLTELKKESFQYLKNI